ncbi:unnamed protein product [marine sediment metagenome]|uniref:Uncharacterized protein n=1 Tax=marine sediment metagenome TaxID=412755 RepID=X1IBI6_9ZZZZ
MQWLIDLVAERVIETIGIPPTFIDRGDPITHDYDREDLELDFNWHDINLSAIVPTGAKAVALYTYIATTAAQKSIQFRKKSNTHTENISRIETQAGNLTIPADLIVACDENQIIQYKATIGVWLILIITIKGWWL